jgi:hypothetical protein
VKHPLACALTLAVTTASSLTLIPPAYAQTAPISNPSPPAGRSVSQVAVTRAVSARAGIPLTHTVRAGDTLAGLAVTYCHGVANDWTGFYHDNRKVIGANPNLIFPGQHLNLLRCTDPPALLHLGSTYHAPARHAAAHRAARSGKVWGVTRGYPNFCGDGDGDGWDVKCHAAAAPAHRTYRAPARRAAVTGSSRYSYAGLEALWVSAGGPAWAAAHAAEIAECESGGNVYAHNPSGATGLWQILGSVVPGSLYNPYVNALNAVAKFRASRQTFAQWVCR